MVYMANHNTAEQVFTQFLNEGQWPSQGLSFFVGLIGPVFAFAGGDAAVHVTAFSKHGWIRELTRSSYPKKSPMPQLRCPCR